MEERHQKMWIHRVPVVGCLHVVKSRHPLHLRGKLLHAVPCSHMLDHRMRDIERTIAKMFQATSIPLDKTEPSKVTLTVDRGQIFTMTMATLYASPKLLSNRSPSTTPSRRYRRSAPPPATGISAPSTAPAYSTGASATTPEPPLSSAPPPKIPSKPASARNPQKHPGQKRIVPRVSVHIYSYNCVKRTSSNHLPPHPYSATAMYTTPTYLRYHHIHRTCLVPFKPLPYLAQSILPEPHPSTHPCGFSGRSS